MVLYCRIAERKLLRSKNCIAMKVQMTQKWVRKGRRKMRHGLRSKKMRHEDMVNVNKIG
jgi:hypothetical protein